MAGPLSTRTYLALTLGLLFVVLSVVVVVLVHRTMKQLALTDAEYAARMLLDHNLAVHTYFSQDLKPKLFEQLAPHTSKDYFEPVWMSSTYAIRKMDKYFHHFNESPYYYKECAINARSPENEADAYEAAFLVDLQNDSRLTTKSAIRVLDGVPYFTLLRRGEAMEASCLRCHSSPDKAPGDLVRQYGPERSFHRKVDDVVQAISIRIPLSEAFSSASGFSRFLSGLLLVALGGGFLFIWIGNKRLLIGPLAEIQEQAVRIASRREYLGETIPDPKIRELRDLVTAFNRMSLVLKKTYDEQEQLIVERTRDLAMEKERLAVTMRSIGDGVISTDNEGRVLSVNQTAEKLTGWPETEALGRDLQEVFRIVNEETRQPCENPVQRVIQHGQVVGLANHTVLIGRDGTERVLADSAAPIRSEAGEIVGVVLVFKDVTEQAQAERALQESEARYRQLVDHMSDAVAVYRAEHAGEDFICVEFNAAGERIEKINKNEFIGRSVLSVFPRVKEFGLFQVFQRVWRTGVSEYHPVAQYEDDRIQGWRDNYVYRLPSGEIVAVYRDETERKRAEEVLRESERNYRELVQNANSAIIRWKTDGTITFLNEYAQVLFGYGPDEAVGKNVGILVPATESTGRDLSTLVEDIASHPERYVNNINENICRDGRRIWMAWTNKVTVDADTGLREILAVGSDITALKRAEEDLRNAEERYRSVFENAAVGIDLVDAEGRFLEVNDSLAQMLGYTADELLNLSIFDVTHPEDVEASRSNYHTMMQGETDSYRFEKRYVRKDRVLMLADVSVSAVRGPDGSHIATVGVISDITERKRAEEALRESEQKFSAAFQFAPMPMTITSMDDGRFIDANDTFLTTYGYTRAEVVGKTAVQLGIWRDEDERSSRLDKTRTEGSVRNLEVSFPTKEGSLRHGLFSAVTIHMVGRPVLLSSFNDITERKIAEEALREREQMVSSIAVAAPMGLCLTKEGIIQWANAEWRRMFGFTHESEYVGQPTGIMYSTKAEYTASREAVYGKLEKGVLGETHSQFMRRDGSQFQGYLRSTYLDPSRPDKGTLSSISDVTEIMRAERALRASEERYKALFEDSRDAVFVTSRDGEYIEVNNAFCDLLGYDRSELGSLKAQQLYMDAAHRSVFQDALEKAGSLKDYPVNVCTKEGTVLEVLVSATVRHDHEGAIVGYQGIIRDVTRSRQLEKQLLQAQKMESIGTLAGGIAHDFNNILQVVLGYSDLLLADKKPDDPDYDDLKRIRGSAQNGAELVKQILTFSRKADISPRPIDLNREVRNAQQLLRRTLPRIIEMELSLGADLWTVNADPGQMEQMLLNLAVNAKDAMPRGGNIVIETENVTLDEDYCKSHLGTEPGDYVQLMFSDTGVGIYPEALEHIFEPFFTTKKPGEGTGLGLAMVYGIVKQHNGHITCYSAPEKGTTFKIYLPAIKTEDLETTGQFRALPKGGTETILLVDDEELVRDLGERILSRAGYTVLKAGKGQEALEVYREKMDRIHLVILDLIMPVMEGHECLQELVKIKPSVKVVVASGYSANGPARKAIKSGARGFVRKPFDIRQMLEAVRKALDEEEVASGEPI